MPYPTVRAMLALSVTSFVLGTSPVLAQDSEGLFQMLGRIILGTGTAKVAIDTPQAVTAIDQADLDRRQPTTLGDLVKTVPGVSASGGPERALGQALNIRGIGATEQTASEERIKVVVDGAPKFFEQYRMGSFFGDLDLYKGVEVLRGPASSTLYGSGAIGGVLAFTTKDASDFLAEGESTALRFKGSYATNGNTVGTGLTLAHRVGGAEYLFNLNRSTGSNMTNGAGGVIAGSAVDQASALMKGKFTFGNDDDQSLTFAYSRTESQQNDTPVDLVSGMLATFGTMDVTTNDETATLTYHHGFAASDLLDLTVQLSHTDTVAVKNDFSANCGAGNSLILCNGEFDYATTTLKIENTSDLSAGAWENYLTFGLQLSEQNRSGLVNDVTAGGAPIIGAVPFHPGGTDTKLGLYAQGEFTLNERLTIIPGVRVDYGQRTPSGATVAADGSAIAGLTATQDTAVSPKIAVLYKLDDTWTVFGSYAETERMPTMDELFSDSATQVPALTLRNEKAKTTEFGITYQREGVLANGDSLQVKATAFNNDLTDLIARQTTAGTPFFANLQAAQIWGAELEAAYTSDRFFGNLAWSNVRSKNKATGRTLVDTPAESLVLTLGTVLPDQNLRLGWTGNYHDKITTYNANGTVATTSGPSYHTHDIFATWSPEEGLLAGLDVNLTVENIFDVAYRNNLSPQPAGTTVLAAGINAKLSVTRSVSW